MQVSVIIIGRNEGERLIRCITSVKDMDFDPEQYEIIYVDSGSTDASVDQAQKLGARVIELDTDKPTAAKGRNAGCGAAQAPLLFFLDGDTIVEPSFLSQAAAFLEEHDDVAAVSGFRKEIHPEASIYNRILDLEWLHHPGYSQYCGGDTVMRKEALEQAGGYKEDLIAGEEPELCHRIRSNGWKIYTIEAMMTGHDLNISKFAGYWKRCYRAGHAYAEVAKLTAGETFGRESKHNWVQSLVYMGAAIALLALLKLWALIPIALGYAVLVARNITKNRWRKLPFGTLLLYGMHAHLVWMPVMCGQIQYHLNRMRNRGGKIIEYK
ncbi:Glycosyltransferase family 2 protein [Sulfidibacter corallicola]|uniref:Glycosyltransferase family 2 protein n=1 Tax=Sulfidibacter corallicola TaxID=2818388 RepID=A0A8A4TI82_SULCO|nr:glycosyltransferase family A protein [Sulfidibacter corallicola]QTD48541.1 glycosyltransferase family 2 protein [Sulfidibacter corallicola]